MIPAETFDRGRLLMELSTTHHDSLGLRTPWLHSHTMPAPLIPKLVKDRHHGDRIFAILVKLGALSVVSVLVLIGLFLLQGSVPAIRKFGWEFVVSSTWDPVQDIYGAFPVIFGTLVSSLLAMTIATPLSVGIALFLVEIAPPRMSKIIGFLIEMLAAIPSVVYGLWGIFVLAPFLRDTVEPALASSLGFLPLFQGPPYGVGMLAAGIILAIMVIPTISSISKEVFQIVPRNHREAALALGATRTEMIWLAVVRSSKAGVFGAIILGLGRALGETMAVTMVIGNRAGVSASLFAPSQTMASVIANEYAEASSGLHLAALAEIGLLLFAVTFVVNGLARIVVWKVAGKGGV